MGELIKFPGGEHIEHSPLRINPAQWAELKQFVADIRNMTIDKQELNLQREGVRKLTDADIIHDINNFNHYTGHQNSLYYYCLFLESEYRQLHKR